MKPLENKHLLGREKYCYPELNMGALGHCASRVGLLFLDTSACTPTCDLSDEEKEYMRRMFEKKQYRNWHPNECAEYVIELIKEIDRNKGIVTTKGVIAELHINKNREVFDRIKTAFGTLKGRLEDRVVGYKGETDLNFRKIELGLMCLRKHYKLSSVDYKLLCSAVNMASRSDQPIGLLTNDAGLLKSVESYNQHREGFSSRYFMRKGQKLYGYTFLSERSPILTQTESLKFAA
jgi:hypothetical protein